MKAIAQWAALCCSLIFFFTAANSVAAVPGLQQQIPAVEYAALVDFYTSTQGPNWGSQDGWNDPAAPSWSGVTVSEFQYDEGTGQILSVGHVTGLVLRGNGLTGSIPDSLGNLSNLQELSIADTSPEAADPRGLSGSIPDSLGNLVNLQKLDLHYGKLSGSIPDSLGNLVNLQYLDLTWNQLSGSIPDSLGNLVNLQQLWLFANQLSGNIPDSLGNLVNLQYLELFSNQLSGSIPDTLGNLVNLQDLDLFYNQLSGSIPDSLGNLVNLQERLDLGRNYLSGNIPDSLGNLVNLQFLSFSDNQLSGNIPHSFGNLVKLDILGLDANQLSGNIPDSLGNLVKLVVLGVSDNHLSGSIPDFSAIAPFEYFDLRQNCYDISPSSQARTIIDKMIQAGKQVSYEPQNDDCGPGPLVLTCPADLRVPKEADECSAVVNYPASVPSGGVGPYTVVCSPLSDSVFPTGATTVHCTVTDAASDTATCSFTVAVYETVPPVITCPSDLTVQCLRDVPPPNFSGSVTDNCDPNPVVTHVGDVASGTNPTRITRTYQATDASGNAARCSQTITVQGLAGGFDLNGDCCVDRTDLNLLMDKIRARSTDFTYDHNGDGKVDVADARFLALHFTNPGGAPCGSP